MLQNLAKLLSFASIYMVHFTATNILLSSVALANKYYFSSSYSKRSLLDLIFNLSSSYSKVNEIPNDTLHV